MYGKYVFIYEYVMYISYEIRWSEGDLLSNLYMARSAATCDCRWKVNYTLTKGGYIISWQNYEQDKKRTYFSYIILGLKNKTNNILLSVPTFISRLICQQALSSILILSLSIKQLQISVQSICEEIPKAFDTWDLFKVCKRIKCVVFHISTFLLAVHLHELP